MTISMKGSIKQSADALVSERLSDISDRVFRWGLLACVVLATVVRSFGLITRSYECDEVYELKHLSTNLIEIANDPDGFPPLFRWLASIVHACFDESAIRVFCGMLGVGVVVVIATTARAMMGNRAGLSAAVFSALSSHQVEFSQLTRAYGLYVLCVGMCLLAVWQVVAHESRWRWMLFVLTSFLVMGTHYFAGFFIVMVWLWVLLQKGNLHSKTYWICVGLFVALCIPWIACLRIDLSNPAPMEVVNRFDFTGWAYTNVAFVQGWAVGPSSLELQELPTSQGIFAILPWATASFVCAAITGVNAIRYENRKASALLIALILLTPLFAGVVATLASTSYTARYMAWIAVPVAIMIGGGMRWRGWKPATFATYALIGINVFSLWNRFLVPKYDRENYKELARFVVQRETHPVVIVMTTYIGDAVAYALPKSVPCCSIGIGTNEPHDWVEVLSQRDWSDDQAQEVLIVAEWMKEPNIRAERRDEFLKLTKARKVARISNTIEVYSASPADLRESFGK
jgi:hypothetical protein